MPSSGAAADRARADVREIAARKGHAVDNARDAGADEFFLVPSTSDPDELARTCDALGL